MILIKNGTVKTMAGPDIENGQVLIDGGKIVAVGKEVNAPADAQVIDAQGCLVAPGFVEAHCHIGLDEEAIGFEGDDYNEMTDPVTPQMRGIDGLNPMDEALFDAYSHGVTTAVTGPGSANVVGGTFLAIKLCGKRVDNMVINPCVAMKCAFGENPKRVYRTANNASRMATASKLRELILKTIEYDRKIKEAGDDPTKLPKFDFKLDAMLPVIRKEIPLKAHAHRTDDIFTAIRIAKEFGLKLTLEHVTEGHLIVDELMKENLPMAVGPSFGQATKVEIREKSFKTPGILAKAGGQVSIITDAPVIPQQYLPLCAELAIKSGMEPFAALQAITINPAKHIGVEDRVGSLEVGKDADIVIMPGSCFDIAVKPSAVLIDGEIVK